MGGESEGGDEGEGGAEGEGEAEGSEGEEGESGDDAGLHTWVQCDACDKWRKIECRKDEVPDEWYCHMNPDTAYNSCQAQEEQVSEEED